ncbi:2-isopropylmalate synthase, partial [Rhizobium ruizarguesonis]
VEFREEIQRITDVEGKELPSRRIYDRFIERYVTQPEGRLRFVDHHTYPDTEHKGQRIVAAEITDNGEIKRIEGRGNGP